MGNYHCVTALSLAITTEKAVTKRRTVRLSNVEVVIAEINV